MLVVQVFHWPEVSMPRIPSCPCKILQGGTFLQALPGWDKPRGATQIWGKAASLPPLHCHSQDLGHLLPAVWQSTDLAPVSKVPFMVQSWKSSVLPFPSSHCAQ